MDEKQEHCILKVNCSIPTPLVLKFQATIFDPNQCQSEELAATFEIIKEWKVKKIFSVNYQYKNIFKNICHINFSALKYLYLLGADIDSIQLMSRIIMPNLQIFNIGNNSLNNIKNLRKTNWPHLKLLCFFSTLINDCHQLSQMSFLSLKFLACEFEKNEESRNGDANWLMKLEKAKLSAVWINSQKRILNHDFDVLLAKKYGKIQLNSKEQETEGLYQLEIN